MELELESLIIPEVDSIKEPGHLVMDLPRLWGGATIEERRLLLLAMLDAVYVDTKSNLVVDVKPKTPFRSLPPSRLREVTPTRIYTATTPRDHC